MAGQETKARLLSKASKNKSSTFFNEWASKLLEFAESFAPTTPADWPSPPTTQDGAIDQLATQVATQQAHIGVLKDIIVALLTKLDASPDLAATDFLSSLTNPPDITGF